MVECWNEIKNFERNTFKTLDQNKQFDIVSVSDSYVIVRPFSTGKERILARKEIEDSFNELSHRGEISRSEIQERHSPRNPAYVAAILAALPDVNYSLKSIRLQLKKLKY